MVEVAPATTHPAAAGRRTASSTASSPPRRRSCGDRAPSPRADPDLLAALAVLVAATLLAWSRLSPVARDTLWAEDATRFLHVDDRDGLGATLLRPYAGYLHVVPRLLAALVLRVADLPHLPPR